MRISGAVVQFESSAESPGVAGEHVLARRQPALPSERVGQVACQQTKQMFEHTGVGRLPHQELGIPLDIWTSLGQDACLRPGGCGSRGARERTLRCSFKRLVH